MSANHLIHITESQNQAPATEASSAPIWQADELGWVSNLDAMVAVLSDRGDDSRLLAASRGFLEAFGVSEAAAVGRRIADFTLSETAMLLTAASTRAARLGEASRTTIT